MFSLRQIKKRKDTRKDTQIMLLEQTYFLPAKQFIFPLDILHRNFISFARASPYYKKKKKQLLDTKILC